MITIGMFVERIRRILSGGNPTMADRVQDAEIRLSVQSACNHQLAVQTLSTQWNTDGYSIPAGQTVATYRNIPVQRGDGDYCTATMPVQPMMLPDRVEIFAVYPSGRPREAFMFIPPGIFNTWSGQQVLNPINEILFTAEQRTIEVYHDLIGAGITSLDMKLCVADITGARDNDILPVPPELENPIIAEVLAQYGMEVPKARKEGREAQTAS